MKPKPRLLKYANISIPFGPSKQGGRGNCYHLPGNIEVVYPRTAIASMIAFMQEFGMADIPPPPTDADLEIALANLFNTQIS
jgi:hypothetical protein